MTSESGWIRYENRCIGGKPKQKRFIQSVGGTIVRYLNLKDQGMVLGKGCGTLSMTKNSGYPEKAYALGKKI